MLQFAKLDCLVLLPLGTGPCLNSGLYLLALGLVLLHYDLLWTFLRVLLHSIIDQRFTPRPFFVMTTL
jgi:hypothetical protein